MDRGVALRGSALVKAYNGVTVVRGIDIDVEAGRVRAVIGENGAGKSTLMKMLTGIVTPSSGNLFRDGRPVSFATPRAAMEAGVGIVHQEFQIVPMLSVADNLMLVVGRDTRTGLRGSAAERAFVQRQLDRVGLAVRPGTPAWRLSAGEAQLLEIAKVLASDSRVLVFDEPTSALPPNEVDRLLTLIEGLRAEGHAILYISHHLQEIKRIADDVTVLRDGQLVGHFAAADLEIDEMIRLMVDRAVSLYGDALPAAGTVPVLTLTDAATATVAGLDLVLNRGEILGFAGLIGSGMHEAAMAIAGADRLTAGKLAVEGRTLTLRSPADAAKAGIAIVPEERKVQGVLPELSVQENLHIGRHRSFARGGLLSLRAMRTQATELVVQFGVRLASLEQRMASLSGGNQQKVVVARCVQSLPKVLVLAEPTRGVDIGAKVDIHQTILDLAASGTGVIVVSSELEEVLALSHRVAVFSAGRMVGILPREQATPTAVMRMATPAKKEQTNVVGRAA